MKYVYPTYVVEIGRRILLADLIKLTVLDFDVILGMNWLSKNHATIDCYERCITFEPKEGT